MFGINFWGDFLCKITGDFTCDESIGYFVIFLSDVLIKRSFPYFARRGPAIALHQRVPKARVVGMGWIERDGSK